MILITITRILKKPAADSILSAGYTVAALLNKRLNFLESIFPTREDII